MQRAKENKGTLTTEGKTWTSHTSQKETKKKNEESSGNRLETSDCMVRIGMSYHDLTNKKKKKKKKEKKIRNKWYLSPGTPFPTDPYKQQQRKLSTSKPLQSTRDSPGDVQHLGLP